MLRCAQVLVLAAKGLRDTAVLESHLQSTILVRRRGTPSSVGSCASNTHGQGATHLFVSLRIAPLPWSPRALNPES